MRQPWIVSLAAAAEADLQDILSWTEQRLGSKQASAYAETLFTAFDALEEGPAALGVRRRDGRYPARTLHAARRPQTTAGPTFHLVSR
jgi:plasmid stabilization system protein ParE